MRVGDSHEQQLVIARRGKWSQPGVPHRGWQCIDVEDIGEPDQRCQMCESQSIRYVHYMEHPQFQDVLQVGCICAGHMEGNLIAARKREVSMRVRATKRSRWISRKWKTSAKGNHWIKADGFRVTVYRRGLEWAATVASVDDTFVKHIRFSYPTGNQAKLAAFDLISKLLGDSSQLKWNAA